MHTHTPKLHTLHRFLAWFVATCPQCGAVIPDDQVMCSVCANK